ncbi:helix-turn-helix transcriptional regulator [uncultured Abyssibacter sp.]|uniref:helix-turn-helix transcriptional regulator n=1 Tax=uncultured Abyssibacter sp. TaxID=2320202 RepID=UPI0032B28A9D
MDEATDITPGAALLISVRRRQRLAAVHFPQVSLIHIVEGIKRFRHGDLVGEAQAGDVLVIGAGESLDLTNTPLPGGRYVARCLSISSDLIRDMPPRDSGTSPQPVARLRDPLLSEALDHALAALDNPSDVPPALIRHRLGEIVLTLRHLGLGLDVPATATVSERLRNLLGSRPGHAWRAEDAAALLHQSESTLRRHLARDNTSFRELLDAVRMELALGLLQGGNAPIAAVALDCGYQSASRFAARFRQRYGITPSELRAGRAISGLSDSGARMTG